MPQVIYAVRAVLNSRCVAVDPHANGRLGPAAFSQDDLLSDFWVVGQLFPSIVIVDPHQDLRAVLVDNVFGEQLRASRAPNKVLPVSGCQLLKRVDPTLCYLL